MRFPTQHLKTKYKEDKSVGLYIFRSTVSDIV